MSFGNLPTNIYELLGEEGEVAQPAKSAPKAAPAQAQTKVQSSKPAQGQGRPQGGNRAVEKTSGDQEGDRKKAPRGGKNPADARKPKGADAPRLDRRSGTGRGKEIKKGGAGKGNWGNAENEEQVVAEQKAPEPQPEPEPIVETEEEKAKREAEEKKKAEEREKEERQMTLEEYLNKKKPVGLSLPAPRAPGEGASDNDKKNWASVPVPNKKEDAVPVPEKRGEGVVSEDKAAIAESAKKLSVFTDLGINVRVKDDARSRQKAQRWEENQRRQNDERYAKPATEPKQFKKKKAPYKAPQKTEENFPALSTKA